MQCTARRTSAMGPAGKSTLIVLLMIAGLAQSACAATYTVGGNTGWNLGVSATFFDDWAKPFKFAVGDTLDFPYVGTLHNVFETSQADLASCNVDSPIETWETSGGASVPLTTAGTKYYICGVPGHCLGNMKMTIVVAAAAAPASPPTSAPAPPTVAPAPASVPPTPAPTPVATPASTPSRAPAPATVAPAPARRNSTTPAPAPRSVGSTPGSAGAPGPSTEAPSSSHSEGPAMIVGAVLCVVTSLLFH